MNERILELARQVWPDPNISHVNHEKFAELIVQKCAKMVNDDGDAVMAQRMLARFGVK